MWRSREEAGALLSTPRLTAGSVATSPEIDRIPRQAWACERQSRAPESRPNACATTGTPTQSDFREAICEESVLPPGSAIMPPRPRPATQQTRGLLGHAPRRGKVTPGVQTATLDCKRCVTIRSTNMTAKPCRPDGRADGSYDHPSCTFQGNTGMLSRRFLGGIPSLRPTRNATGPATRGHHTTSAPTRARGR